MSKTPSFDLERPEFRADPFPTYAEMRRRAPVYPHLLPPGQTVFNAGTAWYVTRYDDVVAVLRDHQRFARDFQRAVSPEQLREMVPLPPIMRAFTDNMVNRDEPEHRRLRALINKAFSPRMIQDLRGEIETITAGLIDRVAARGEMELVEDYAYPIPTTVITELLGLPAEDYPLLREFSTLAPPASEEDFEPTARILEQAMGYFAVKFEEKQRNPGDDLTTALVQAEIDGDRLDESNRFAMVMLLLVAGYTTTAHLIGNATLALLQHPDQLELLKRDPSLIESAVEELLRYDGPMETALMRWATEDVEMRGQTIRRGDLVFAVLAAANRDPEVFPDPNRLDLTRSREEGRHVAFGSGIHFCLGAHLARLETQVALDTLFRRLPDLRLAVPADQLCRHDAPPTRGLEALPVAWSVG